MQAQEPIADPSAARPGLLAAAIKLDITPDDLTGLHPVGGGSFGAVHDAIFLRALLLAGGGQELAIVSLELIEVGDMVPLRERLERELGIPSAHVLICATHTHSAPRIGHVSPGGIAHELGPEAEIYSDWVYAQIVESIRRARAALAPACLGFGVGHVDVNVNRDEYHDGAYRLGVNPDGPSDKTLSVVDIAGLDGAEIAVLMTYAVHPTATLGTKQVSSDIAGAAARSVEQTVGGGAVALWTAGALGDQEARALPPRPPLHDPLPGDYDPSLAFALADAQGRLIAAEAMRVRGTISRYDRRPRISARELVTELPAKLRPPGGMKTIKQQRVETVALRMIVVRLGAAAIVGVGGEVSTNIAAKLRAASPLTHTLVLSLVNDRLGYLVDDAAFPMETFEVRGSPIAEGYAEAAIVGCATTIHELLQ